MKVAIVAALATCAITAGEQIKDVDGWQSAKWGMSKSAITDAYKGQVKADPKLSGKRGQFLDLLEPLVIADNPFAVVFRFDNESNGLNLVTLSPTDFRTPPEALLDQMLKLLIEKYGAPAVKEEKVDAGADDRRYRWLYPSSVLTLTFSNFRAIKGLTILYLTYEKRDATKSPL